MMTRSRKQTDPNQQHWYVIYGFVAVCAIAVLMTLFNPKQKISEQKIIDDTQILVHNGQGHQFKHGRNMLFEQKTMADAKKMF